MWSGLLRVRPFRLPTWLMLVTENALKRITERHASYVEASSTSPDQSELRSLRMQLKAVQTAHLDTETQLHRALQTVGCQDREPA